MDKLNILCFGFGQVAKSFIEKINSKKIPINLSVTSRQETESKFFGNISYKSFQLDENKYDENLLEQFEIADHILISIPPIAGKDIVLKHFQNKLKNPKLKWVTYLSATSVYGNHDGNWVNEKSETNPTSTNGKDRLLAEEFWKNFTEQNKIPFQVFRLSGIYSNQFNVLKRIKMGEAKIIRKKNHYFSRIHVEDIANVLFYSLKNFKKGEVYNISDDKPASLEEVIMYGVNLLNVDTPKVISEDEIESQMLKNFYKDSKKVSNKKMKEFFNIKLKFPTYIEGLNYINNNFV